MNLASYQHCYRLARRLCPAELAEDILQEALIVAAQQQRLEMDQPQQQAWLAGVIKHLLSQHWRTQQRRRVRDRQWLDGQAIHAEVDEPNADEPSALTRVQRTTQTLLGPLSPALRQVFALVAHGLNRNEIRWILQLDDATLRQRISALRKALARLHQGQRGELLALAYQARERIDAAADLGPIRSTLLRVLQAEAPHGQRRLGLGDPDGHLLIVDCAAVDQ